MNSSLVKSKPHGRFVIISALKTGWREQFTTLIQQKKFICYDMYPLLNIPQEFQARLQAEGYSDLIPRNDRWEHYLIPPVAPGLTDLLR